MKLIKKFLQVQTFTPSGFLCWAAFFALFYGVCEIAGWREHMTFLTGTATSETESLQMSAGRGLIYMMSYFGFVLLVPILIMAATVFGFILLRKNRHSVKPISH